MDFSGTGAPGDTPSHVRQCICSPTTHPGSFRCRLHRGVGVARSASYQQFGAPRSRSLCSDHHIRRVASQLQLTHPTSAGGGMSSSTSEHQSERRRGKDFLTKE
nr:unnamed protein product [Digitaria exilis]